MTVLLTRRAVVQAKNEAVYNVAETLGANDGVLVMNPQYTVNPNVLERNIMRDDISKLPVVMGRKLSQMKFSTELRGNGKQNSGLAADAPLIARLFRACGFVMTAMPSPDLVGVYPIGDQAIDVAWARSSGAAATGTLTTTGNFVNNETVTIDGKVYTFKTALTDTDGFVLLGVSAASSLANLKNAITLGAGAGSAYAASTTLHPSVTASSTSTTLVVTAKNAGTAGNSIPSIKTATNATWGGATLSGGSSVHSATEVITYILEVVTGGPSATATIKVTSETVGEELAAATVTTGSPFTVGTKGLTLTPTFTGSLVSGQKWFAAISPSGLRLDPISTGFESITLRMNRDGVEHSMPGSFGTFSITAEAGQFSTVDWTFTGTYVDPVDAAMASPNYEKTLPAQVELARLRLDGFYAIVNRFSFDIGNDIQVRPDVSSAEGYIGTRLVARDPKAGVDPEADLVANQNFWAKFGAATRMPFQMRVGKVKGNEVWFLMPCVQYTGLTYGDRNGILTLDAGLSVNRVNGNDEVCILLV